MKATLGLLTSLALLATLVSHDVLMAAGDHVSPSPVVEQRARVAHQAPDAGTPACVVTQPATMPQATGGIDLSWAIVPAPWSCAGIASGRSLPAPAAPGHPPSMSRAFLQVYRN